MASERIQAIASTESVAQPLMVRPREAWKLVGGRYAFERLIRAAEIKPVVAERRLVLYAYTDLRWAVEGLKAGRLSLNRTES